MKKIAALALVVAMSAITMCACSNGTNDGSQTSEISSVSDSSNSSQNSEPENVSSDSSSASHRDELLSFTFKMDGVEYTLPCDFSEFAKLGYSFDEDEELDGNTYTIGVSPKKDGETLNVQMWNPTDSPKKYSECQVGSIGISIEDGHELILPGDLKFDETITVDVVKEMYGEPDDTIEGNGYIVLTYEKDSYQEVKFSIYTEEDSIQDSSVHFENYV